MSSIAPSPIERMINTMNEDRKNTGMSCQIKRRLPDGSLQDADPRALDALGTKSRMAYAAQNLKQMSPAARTAWAIEMKDFANSLYAEQKFVEAMEKYVEALAASNFGQLKSPSSGGEAGPSTGGLASVAEEGQEELDIDLVGITKHNVSENNINDLVIPVLCNLAACCIQIKQYSKAYKFCDAALELRPRCGKALMRRGMALVHLGENDAAVKALNAALTVEEGVLEVGEDSSTDASDPRMVPIMEVSASDRQRIPILIQRACRGKKLADKGKANQRKGLQKVFGGEAKRGSSQNHAAPAGAAAAAVAAEAAEAVESVPQNIHGMIKAMACGLLLAVVYTVMQQAYQ